MDIKIVEAYLKRVIKAADHMRDMVHVGDGFGMQTAVDHYDMAKKLFVNAANEFKNQKTPHEIYSAEDQQYYDEMYGNV